MDLNIKSTSDINQISEYISSTINNELKKGKNVLWFVTGGSSVPLQIEIAKKINEEFSNKLVVTLTDERYGPQDSEDSNWHKLITGGFNIKGVTLIPILTGKDFKETAREAKENIKREIEKADYKVGIFGIGIDCHTAGILPRTQAVKEDDLVCAYETELFDRITITPKVVRMLDQAFVYSMGELKWPAIESLKTEKNIDDEPAQILKFVPLLTIFSDLSSK